MELIEGQEIQFQSFSQKFVYIKDLGSGGTGRTILAKDKLTGALFAIKKFSPIQTEYTEDLFKRFIDEIITLNNISHNNIVRIYTYYVFEDLKVGYIQMEYVDGYNIKDVFDFASIGLEEDELPDKLFEQAISAFCYLEKLNILHRDIRANNVLVDKSNRLKIIDFGFGKILNTSKGIAESIILNWPATSMPEEIEKEAPLYDKATEIYFLGNLFKELLKNNSTITFSYKSIINKMVQTQRKDRYLCFADIQAELSKKIYVHIFTTKEKEIYSIFSNIFSNILVSFLSNFEMDEDIDSVIGKCNEVLEKSILEDNIQNNNQLINCFIRNGSFKYSTSIEIPVNVFDQFVQLLNDATPLKQNLIISNLGNRIKKAPVTNVDADELPF